MSSFDKSGKPKMDALIMLRSYPGKQILADFYDDDQDFSDAISEVFGDSFEYPDFSHLTMDQVVKKAEKESAKDLPSPQELTLSEFSKFATVVKLKNHGRKWEVFYGENSMGFADGASVSGALKQAHFGAVNNAIYANSPDAPDFMKGTKVFPPEHVVAEYLELKVRFADVFDKKDAAKALVSSVKEPVNQMNLSNHIEPSAMTTQTKSSLADGEVLGRDTDGGLIQWDATTGARYNSGQTAEEFGMGNLSEDELNRLKLSNCIEHPDMQAALDRLMRDVDPIPLGNIDNGRRKQERTAAETAIRAALGANVSEETIFNRIYDGMPGWPSEKIASLVAREVEMILDSTVELPAIDSEITVLVDRHHIPGIVTGHSIKDGKPVIDYLGPHILSSGQFSEPSSRWAWPSQLIQPQEKVQGGVQELSDPIWRTKGGIPRFKPKDQEVAPTANDLYIDPEKVQESLIPEMFAPSFEVGQRFDFKAGDQVVANGYRGTVSKVLDGQLEGMLEVRLPGGTPCMSASFPDCFPAVTNGVEVVTDGRFIGAVKEVSGQFVVQDAGRGRLVAHECHRFDGLPAVGDVIDLQHRAGKVAFAAEKDKGRGKER